MSSIIEFIHNKSSESSHHFGIRKMNALSDWIASVVAAQYTNRCDVIGRPP